MKRLGFEEKLIPLILSGKKTSTWRLFDEKNIKEGDELSLVDSETGNEFARATVHSLKETTFGKLNDEDKKGHETFSSDRQMYNTYSGYYKTKIDENTPLKICRFELINQDRPK